MRRGRFEDRFLLTGQMIAVQRGQPRRSPAPQLADDHPLARGRRDGVVKAGRSWSSSTRRRSRRTYGEKTPGLDQARERSRPIRSRPRGPEGREALERRPEDDRGGQGQDRGRDPAGVPARARSTKTHQLALARAVSELDKAREDLSAFEASSDGVRPPEDDRGREGASRVRRGGIRPMDGMVLKAPRDGILVVADHPWQGRKIQVGDAVWVGLPVVSLPDLARDGGRGEALSDVDDGRIAPGLSGDLRPRRVPGPTRTRGASSRSRRSRRRPPAVRSAGRTTFVWPWTLPTPQRMRPGMSVKVEVHPEDRDDVLLAPREGLDLAGAQPRARLALGEAGRRRARRLQSRGVRRAQGRFEDGARLKVGRDEAARLVVGAAAASAILAGLVGVFARDASPKSVWAEAERGDLVLTVEVDRGPRGGQQLADRPAADSGLLEFKIAMMAPEGTDVHAGTPVLGFDTSELERKLLEKTGRERVRRQAHREEGERRRDGAQERRAATRRSGLAPEARRRSSSTFPKSSSRANSSRNRV